MCSCGLSNGFGDGVRSPRATMKLCSPWIRSKPQALFDLKKLLSSITEPPVKIFRLVKIGKVPQNGEVKLEHEPVSAKIQYYTFMSQ